MNGYAMFGLAVVLAVVALTRSVSIRDDILLVVLCGDAEAQPIVNARTSYG